MKRRIVTISLVVPLLIPLFTGCAVSAGSASEQPSGQPSAASAPSTPGAVETATMREGVPGYPMGEIPPVPLFVMPDLSMLDSSMAGFSIKVRDTFPSVPGVTIRPARCDKGGNVETDSGSLRFYGDGSGNYTDGNGHVVNYGDGSGNYTINGVTVHVYGDGSGNYNKGDVSINTYGDGSGNYTDGNITINNYGDRTGNYNNAATGEVLKITPEPIAPIAPLGTFPSMGTLKPIKSCGTRITIDDSVLFDFNKDTLRPSAKDTMAKLATVFTSLKIKNATISGHTDAIGTDAYNQDLSERRANSVKQALLALNVTTNLNAIGYGETKPVAPNQLNGKDNPAGRQANRRVEIFIPNS